MVLYDMEKNLRVGSVTCYLYHFNKSKERMISNGVVAEVETEAS